MKDHLVFFRNGIISWLGEVTVMDAFLGSAGERVYAF